MLAAKNRLPYSELAARGYQTVRTPYFSLKIRNNGLPHYRIGVVIGVAAEKKAVRRNFWKRQAKTILATPANNGKDLIVIFSKKIKELNREQFKKELYDLPL